MHMLLDNLVLLYDRTCVHCVLRCFWAMLCFLTGENNFVFVGLERIIFSSLIFAL